MATILFSSLLILSLASFLTFISPVQPVGSPSSSALIDWWCSQTPHPAQCKSSLENSPPSAIPKRRSQFKKLAVDAAVKRALKAQNRNKWLGPKCRNRRERAAWTDCINLYQSTISQLNRTVDPSASGTAFDVQIWLSAALTNLQTCRAGFRDLNVTDNVLPLMMSNNTVSYLISNALAINNASIPSQANTNAVDKQGFPTWLSAGDRKLLQSSTLKADLVVAKDGSGNFMTIKEAINAAAATRSDNGRFIIYVKSGLYEENLSISGSKLKNLMLIGDGLRWTIITGSRSVGGGSTTFNSATVAVTADGFIARGIGFQNTAGPQNNQAVALRSGSDLSVFYRCSFSGYQDTLYVHSQRQFYRECYIYGTVDFIFGNAAVVLQNCMIYSRRPLDKQKNTVTASSRTDPNQNTGISIHNSRIMAAPDLVPALGLVKSYLGRPWQTYARTVYMQCFIDTLIDPEGWLPWSGTFALDTLYYGEYNNYGPGSSTSGRVKWKGYHVIQSPVEASQFTVAQFIAGNSWLPATGVPFTPNL
ncbi:hypothetical protein SAY86_028535 [Trapa natans]|uniref:Pectinesterase n=1 Tax=Trapa natans TaxID=22666 RepID=A0AAN7M0T0_TRANT|nr:hypothetical protein SAY86_028535 [Trapa natans]